MNYWLMKSEPSCYSIADLQRDRVTMWDGTRNYQVRNMMRDDMRVGDQALFYHSNAGVETAVVGVMTVVKAAYPDPTQFDPKSDHPDPQSDKANPRWLCVDVEYTQTLTTPVLLSDIKLDPQFADMPLVKKGNRLSVMPIAKKHFTAIKKLGA